MTMPRKGLRELIRLAALVQGVPLQEIVDAIDCTEPMAPFVSPELYLQSAFSLSTVRRLAESLIPFQALVKSLEPDPEILS